MRPSLPARLLASMLSIVALALSLLLGTAGSVAAAPATAVTTPSGAPSAVQRTGPQKELLSGLMDRGGQPKPLYRTYGGSDLIRDFVVNAYWNQIQPDGPADFKVDDLQTQFDAANAAGARVRLRIFAGRHTPAWVKQEVGTVNWVETTDTSVPPYQLPRFWTRGYQSRYEDMLKRLSDAFDSNPAVGEVTISMCMTTYAEPFNRQAGSAENKAAALAGGYSYQDDLDCLANDIDLFTRTWPTTPAALAVNPFSGFNPPSKPQQLTDTFALMDYCRAQLGDRCVLGNNSVRGIVGDKTTCPDGTKIYASDLNAAYDSLFCRLTAMGGPTYIQTANPDRVGDLPLAVRKAASYGATSVELPRSYTGMTLAEIAAMRDSLIPPGTKAADNARSDSAVALPKITAITPKQGPTTGGQTVTITGSGFQSPATVKFGPTAATGVKVVSATKITAVSPARVAGKVQIRVTTSAGTSPLVGADVYQYVAATNPAPAVTGISPASGPQAGGTAVTITGTALTGATVKFGAVTGTVTANTATSITVTSPAAANPGAATVTVTTSTGSATTNFTYVAAPAAPVVTGISPANGPQAGGTAVNITGTALTGATVKFGALAGTVTANTATSITVTSPAAANPGAVTVTVTTSAGSATSSFTYNAPPPAAPAITGVSPTTGPTTGGTAVTITGTGFTGATAVAFGPSAAASFQVLSPTQISAVSPARPAGKVQLRVTTAAGTSALVSADVFQFVVTAPNAPVVTGLSPTSGPVAGGTTVTITGTDLAGATAVKFGTATATITANTATSITATAPAGANPGTVSVTVTTGGGTSSGVNYTYQAAAPNAPVVTALSPGSGPLAGGTTVTITGTDLGGATAVNFGTATATITANTATSITATAPAGANPGTVSVTVTTGGGTSAGVDYTYETPVPNVPVVTGLTPTSGPLTGGTAVTITGTDLAGATAVNFGTATAAITANTATSITATAPAGANPGAVSVTVTTGGGTSTGVDYTYETPAPGVVKLATGGFHTCTLTSDDVVRCWGLNGSGQLGNGTRVDSRQPVTVPVPGDVVDLTAGGYHTCALNTAGDVYCWGANERGQLGDGTKTDRTEPTLVAGLPAGAVALSAGGWHTCALAQSGSLTCWGANERGQLGDGTTTDQPAPAAVTGIGDATAVAAGSRHTCAIVGSGVRCWGDGTLGQLGGGTAPDGPVTEPTAVVGLGAATSLTAGTWHTCATTAAGMSCWGYNRYGGLGDGTTVDRSSPVSVDGVGTVTGVAAGGFHTCALTAAGRVSCWGLGRAGQTGAGFVVSRPNPGLLPGSGTARLVGAGGFHACAVVGNASVRCWGGNEFGQLANGNLDDDPTADLDT